VYENKCDKFLMIRSLVQIVVETKFGQKTACLDMATFLPNLGKNAQVLRFGRDLVAV
jgi:hypothetical protein